VIVPDELIYAPIKKYNTSLDSSDRMFSSRLSVLLLQTPVQGLASDLSVLPAMIYLELISALEDDVTWRDA
jgi:hypothetical protein